MARSPYDIDLPSHLRWIEHDPRISRREIEPAKPSDPVVVARGIADDIEDARTHLQRFRLRIRLAGAVASTGVAGIVGGIALGGAAATFNLGLAPLVAAAIVAGIVLTALGAVGIGLSYDTTPGDEHPADRLRRMQRRERDHYLKQAEQ